ncbi:unannotated protein [freshwater metagenome]|uniref:Unannotated protein n=1 Tax=freshwater metagenome TaxID=449393 RepID=A0A6J6JBD8_9ZZZZ
MRNSGANRVCRSTAEFFHADVFARDGLDDVGSRDKHLARFVDHDHKVGERGRIHRTTRRRATDDRELRDNTAGLSIEAENLAVLTQGRHTFLNSSTARIENSDDRHTRLERVFLEFDDFGAGGFAERPAKDTEVLTEDAHLAAVNSANTHDDGVTVGAFAGVSERIAARTHKLINFGEAGSRVDELHDARHRRILALGFLLFRRGRLSLVELLEPRGEIGNPRSGRCGLRGRFLLGHVFTLARVRSRGTYPR